MYLVKKASLYLLLVAGLRWTEFMIRPSADFGLPRPLAALVSVWTLLLAAGGLGVLFGAWWLGRRLRGGLPVPPPKQPTRPSAPLTAADKARSLGRSLALYWMFGGIFVLLVLSDTGVGPFAWAAARLLGHDSAFLAFVFGGIGWLAPMLLLGVLPRQARWQALSGAQDMFKPPVVRARKARKRS